MLGYEAAVCLLILYSELCKDRRSGHFADEVCLAYFPRRHEHHPLHFELRHPKYEASDEELETVAVGRGPSQHQSGLVLERRPGELRFERLVEPQPDQGARE